jgi:predicted aconitase
VLADSLRTDQPCFRRVSLEDPLVIQLRELSRVDEELQRESNQLANRLRERGCRKFRVCEPYKEA